MGAFFGFLVNKFLVRPVLRASDAATPLEALSNSIPNFFEAVMGVTVVTGILISARDRSSKLASVSDRTVYAVAGSLAGAYVLTQEFGLHNIGGNNVFDPNDVAASAIGLVLMTGLFLNFGLFHNSEVRRTGPASIPKGEVK